MPVTEGRNEFVPVRLLLSCKSRRCSHVCRTAVRTNPLRKRIMSVAMPTKAPSCARLHVGPTTNRTILSVAKRLHILSSQGSGQDGKTCALVKASQASRHRPSSDPLSGDTHHEHTTITCILGTVPPRTSADRGCGQRLLGTRQTVRAAERHCGHEIAEGPHRPVQLGDRALDHPRGLIRNPRACTRIHNLTRGTDALAEGSMPR
jgi:hypothetical protein